MATAIPAKRSLSTELSVDRKILKLNSTAAAVQPRSGVVKLTSSTISTGGVDVSAEALDDRDQRFSSDNGGKRLVSLKSAGGSYNAPKLQLGTGGAKAGSIKGTSTELERPYLRLHFVPDSNTIRPPHILVEALKLVKKKWIEKQDFPHATEQLMAIQQDCKLQGIEGTIPCDAYETHIRIALERADLAEFTRCLSSLSSLYHSAVLNGETWSPSTNEFIAYRMLHGMRLEKDLLENISCELCRISAEQRSDPDIYFAISVGKSLMARDFSSFFRLYANAPKMAGHVIDFFVDRVRETALQTYIKAFQPDIHLDDLKHMLCFEKRKQCFRFLRERGIVMSDDKRLVLTKESLKSFKVL